MHLVPCLQSFHLLSFFPPAFFSGFPQAEGKLAKRTGGVAFEVGAAPPKMPMRKKPVAATSAAAATATPAAAATATPATAALPSPPNTPMPAAHSPPPPLRRDGTVVLDDAVSSGHALPHVATEGQDDDQSDSPSAVPPYMTPRRRDLLRRGERITLRPLSSWSQWTAAAQLEVGLTKVEVLDSGNRALPSDELCLFRRGLPSSRLHRLLLEGVGRTTDPAEMWLGMYANGE